MTIITDTSNDTNKTSGTMEYLADNGGVAVAFNHIINDGAQIFLGIPGEHGTTIRLKDNKEKEAMAYVLEKMAIELRAQL